MDRMAEKVCLLEFELAKGWGMYVCESVNG